MATVAPFIYYFFLPKKEKEKKKRKSWILDQIVIETNMNKEEIERKLRETLKNEKLEIDENGNIVAEKGSVFWNLISFTFFIGSLIALAIIYLSYFEIIKVEINFTNLFLIGFIFSIASYFLHKEDKYYDFIEFDTSHGKNYVIIKRFDEDGYRLIDELTIKELVEALGGKIVNVGA